MRRSWSLGIMAACACGMLPGYVKAQEEQRTLRAQAGLRDTLQLTLSDVQRLAVIRNPAFLADQLERPIAEGALRQARTYNFNPTANAQAFQPGVSPGTREYTAWVTQEIQWAGQWGLTADAARAGLARAESGVSDAARLAVADASRAFYAAVAAGQRLGVAEDILGANRRLLDATRIQLREGEISTLEANLADIEYGRSRARVLAARRGSTAALVDLRRSIGIDPQQPVQVADSAVELPDTTAFNLDSLIGLALLRRPDIAALAAVEREFQTLGRLAAREAVPNLQLTGLATRDDGELGSRFGIGVGLPLPLWNRNGGIVEQRRAQAEQARQRRAATELRVRAEVTEAYLNYVAAAEETRTLQAAVLGPVRQNQGLLEIAYKAGKVGLPTLLLVRNQLLDAELEYWNAWQAHHEARVRLEAAVSAPLPGLPSGSPPQDEKR